MRGGLLTDAGRTRRFGDAVGAAAPLAETACPVEKACLAEDGLWASVVEMSGGTDAEPEPGLARPEQLLPIFDAARIADLGIGRSVEEPAKTAGRGVAFRPLPGQQQAFANPAIDGTPAAGTLAASCEEKEGMGP